jgi:nucleoside-diphosphate-sugar epimerase
MRVFVTGASGWVGTGVTRELLAAGHQVVGLARSDQSAAKLQVAGAEVLRGDLSDLEALAKGAREADGVIHLGFIHDFSNFAAAGGTDKTAIETMGAALIGTGKPMLVTSGTAGLSLGRPSTENDSPDPETFRMLPRLSEPVGLSFATQGVRAGVVRLPPTVHGNGDHGFVPGLIAIARQKGVSAYVGTGDNVWSTVHRDDAARVYVLALEKGESGQVHHAVDEVGVPFKDMAEIIGRKLGLPVQSVTREQAPEQFGWMAHFAQFDVPASSQLTRDRLGWTPTEEGLIANLEDGAYFTA